MKIKKFIAVVLMVCLAFGAFVLSATGVLAADVSESETALDKPLAEGFFDVTYDATETYKDSKFYENLKRVPRTGNQALNVIAVALSQVGYHEGNDESDFNGLNTEGNGDFVEYNMVFGKIDYNVRYGYSWCASFATWCLRQAEIDPSQSAQTAEFNDEFKKTYISTWQWKNALENAGRFQDVNGYTPLMGDLIFFKDVDDPTLEVATSHVGIVLYSDETHVYTVEGNTNSKMGGDRVFDCVAVKTYPLDSKYIVGYGQPKYENSEPDTVFVWRDPSDKKTPAKPLGEVIDKAESGIQLVPERYVNEPVSRGGCSSVVELNILTIGISAGVGALAFKKKKD